jgi:hypothetical protein
MLSRKRFAVPFIVLVICSTLIGSPQAARAWGIHSLLTKVSVQLLPDWQRQTIKAEEKGFIDRYCIFPDDAKAPDAAPYIVKFPPEAKVSLHIPGSLERNKMVFDAYLPQIVSLFQAGKTSEAMHYFGCVAHYLEDSACPCHMAHGEIAVPEQGPPLLQMDFFKRFLSLPDEVDQEMLHSRIDGCPMTEQQLCRAVEGYKPRLLGHSVEEMIFNLLEEHAAMNRRSSKQLIPMLQALADGDEAKFVARGVTAAADGTRLVADVLNTVLCLAQSRLETAPPAEVSLADRTPARGSAFSWSDRNHQGQLIPNASGAYARNMSDPPKLGRHPLKLKMADGSVREFAKGYGVGWKTEYTFLLPRGVFKTFTVYAGNDAELGTEGTNTFEILLDGKPAASTPKLIGAALPGQRLEVPLGNATTLTLRCQSEGRANRIHGVWAEPKLVR